jgi:dipeptidyl aminopeptidase/acylaminoacyl peptidase
MRSDITFLKYIRRLLAVAVMAPLALISHAGMSLPGDGISVGELREFASSGPKIEFQQVRHNPSVNGERREVVSFEVDGLLEYGLILWPSGKKPTDGWPVLLFNHGYHPNPPEYGRIADGQNSRPGDYYRGVAQAFVDHGYVVVVPDYRGHNDSEGTEFISRALADHWYTRDAVAAYFGLSSLSDVNLGLVYMNGHSMGGPITQRALLVLGDRIRAASVWSGSAERHLSYMMAREMKDARGKDALDIDKPGLNALAQELGQSGRAVSLEELSARKYIDELQVPLAIHHSSGDGSTGANGSLELAARLYMAGRKYQLFVYESDDHLFSGKDFELAVERDLRWFENHR